MLVRSDQSSWFALWAAINGRVGEFMEGARHVWLENEGRERDLEVGAKRGKCVKVQGEETEQAFC